MNKKIVNLKYIIDKGLHDSELNNIFINYNKKNIVMEISTLSEKIKIILKGIHLLKIEKEDDFINNEIILDFKVNIEKNIINLFTTSNTIYKIEFENSVISTTIKELIK